MANSWQQPLPAEPGGATWHKVEDPSTGWLASKTASWTADSFSGGLTVDFSSVVPAGTRAVRVVVSDEWHMDTGRLSYWRPGSDPNISNTPHASNEYAYRLFYVVAYHSAQVTLWLSDDGTVDFAVTNVNVDLYIAYPVAYLL